LLRRYVHDRHVTRVERFVVPRMATRMAPAVILGLVLIAALDAVVLRSKRTSLFAAVPDLFWLRLCGHRALLKP
jgi:hypothetical protein